MKDRFDEIEREIMEGKHTAASVFTQMRTAAVYMAQPQPEEAGPVAEPEQLWAVHAQGSDDIYPAFSKEDAEKHASELNALPMPEGIAVGAVVVHSPWPAAEHWEYLAEEERDHKEQIMALAAPQSQPAAVPDGYALAPVEPTPAMLAAGLAAHLPQTMGGERLALLYRAMLAAAPAPADHSEDALAMAAPAPAGLTADDVRAACQNAVEVFAETDEAELCREVAEYMREVLLVEFARQAAPAPKTGFCGDPYVHDCGRSDCPTSDSYKKSVELATARQEVSDA